MFWIVKLISAIVLGAVAAQASPWWATFDGSLGTYPEDQGWLHYATDPPAQRWLEDGSLFIDSRAAWGISDIYSQYRPGEMTLGPGETLVVLWRVDVVDAPGSSIGADIEVDSDDQWAVHLCLGIDGVSSLYEPGNWAPFAPGVFHDFLLESSDLRTYVLSVDGVPKLWGSFFESLFYAPGVGWGDMTTDRNLSAWQSVEAGVIPEPSAALCALIALCGCSRVRRQMAVKRGRS
jgi:hypothetical protein